ncbi:hypothetical protein M0R45_028359 [Rubus argutus]|uniref:Mevalonate kinase n=1 Tax=Rubus argutus TaxID=59490 RepID=A0AAW1W7F6_RUBAR
MEVKARAPGKIILSGEHAVVHGTTAVAASIDLYSYVTLRFPAHSENDDLLRLELKDIGLEFSWPVGRIKEALSGIDVPNSSTPTSCSAESIKSLAVLVEEPNLPEGIATGVLAFLWLYSSIQGFKPEQLLSLQNFLWVQALVHLPHFVLHSLVLSCLFGFCESGFEPPGVVSF